MSIAITVNGERRDVEEGITVAALLASLDIRASRVVVEHNMRILRAGDFGDARIEDGDELEVLQFVGGG
ncbi:MAG TPA: sulfur carrier protein ThiS [Candidatus Dormibacteraeota bacterium]|nr:sulfur carrier protein ThiS [Candidatus Dormibacteraeota bacterium]